MRRALLLLLAACSNRAPSADAGALFEPDAGYTCAGLSKGPWAIGMTETSMVVRWETCSAGAPRGLTFGPEAGGAMTRAEARETIATVTETSRAVLNAKAPDDRAGTFYMHEARLEGLAPSTCYRYQLEVDSEAKGRFCTARRPGEPIRFMVIGDTYPELGHAAKVFPHVLARGFDFSLHTGDIQYYSGGLSTWASWFPLMAPQLRAGAMLVAIGNHEYESATEYEQYTRRFFGGSGEGSHDHYELSSGGVSFFTLNTEEPIDPTSAQGQWLSARLLSASLRTGWRFSVVWLHKPLLTCGDTGDRQATLDAWGPTFDQLGVRLVLQGHMHGYERFAYGGRTVITTAGGGAAIKNPNENAQRPFCGPERKSWGPHHHAMIFEVGQSKLHGEAIDEEGKIVDSFEEPLP